MTTIPVSVGLGVEPEYHKSFKKVSLTKFNDIGKSAYLIIGHPGGIRTHYLLDENQMS